MEDNLNFSKMEDNLHFIIIFELNNQKQLTSLNNGCGTAPGNLVSPHLSQETMVKN